jgi:serine/threonine protein kinase
MAKFAGFEPFTLQGLDVTDVKIGEGSYATVHELNYFGLKCAGKKIHRELVEQEGTSYAIHRFQKECQLLSQIRHPNIVQFLGVHFHDRSQIPILVMEFLPANLTYCIETYSTFPHEISYSVLHDVGLGMHYLHNQLPPIIHRDLSSNNVLLASNMSAKIADLGMARIMNLTPLEASHNMTQTPGTPHFMPPEVMVPNPVYNTSVDIFSYGILMVHMFSCRWPEPQIGQTRIDDERLIPVTEAERREVFLRAIGNEHPLMDLILKCIHNNPQKRPHAGEIVERLAEMVLQFPASFANRLEILRYQNSIDIIRHSPKTDINCPVKNTLQSMTQCSPGSCQDLGIEQLEIQLKDLDIQKQILEAEVKTVESERRVAKLEVASLSKQVEKLKETLSNTIHRFKESYAQELGSYRNKIQEECKLKLAEEKSFYEETLQQERRKYEQLVKDCEKELANESQKSEAKDKLCDEIRANNSVLSVEAIGSAAKIESLHSSITTLEEKLAAMSSSVTMKDTEIDTKTQALQEKDITISALNEQLRKARNQLCTKQQVSQFKYRKRWLLKRMLMATRNCVLNKKCA